MIHLSPKRLPWSQINAPMSLSYFPRRKMLQSGFEAKFKMAASGPMRMALIVLRARFVPPNLGLKRPHDLD